MRYLYKSLVRALLSDLLSLVVHILGLSADRTRFEAAVHAIKALSSAQLEEQAPLVYSILGSSQGH